VTFEIERQADVLDSSLVPPARAADREEVRAEAAQRQAEDALDLARARAEDAGASQAAREGLDAVPEAGAVTRQLEEDVDVRWLHSQLLVRFAQGAVEEARVVGLEAASGEADLTGVGVLGVQRPLDEDDTLTALAGADENEDAELR
jgi:hypothetical protein